MALAEKWERQAKQLGPAQHLQNREAVLEAFISATQAAIRGDFNEATARGVLDHILHASGNGAIKAETVRRFANTWLETRAEELAEGTREAYRHAITLFLTHLGPVADKPLDNVTNRHVETFKAARIAVGLSAKTVDRDLKVVRSIFRAGVNQAQTRFDPTQAVPLVSRKSKAKAQKVSREILSSAELDAILSKATGEWLTAALIGRYTGARLGDCVRMRWSNIDLTERVIRYSDQKTGKDYAVPIHHRLHEHLMSIANNDNPHGLLSPTLAAKETGGCNGLSAQFQKVMKAAGVDTMELPTKALRKVEGKIARTHARRSFHSIRHSYNSELANADVPQEIRRKLVGHASDDINDVYTHLDVEVFRGAINKLA